MQATPSLDLIPPKPPELTDFAKVLQKMWRNLVTNVINGHVGFGDGTNHDNIDGVWANVVAPVAPNTDFVVTHNLGRVPVGYWVMQKDRACDVYTGSVAATSLQITLRATVASAVLRLFILSFVLALFGVTSFAQTTNLTLQVTDAGGQTWNNGTWSAVLSTPPGVGPPGPPFNQIGTTTPVPNQSQSGTLSGTGSATATFWQNASIVPALSQWKFVVCPQTSPGSCFAQFVTITSTATLTLTPPSILMNCGPGVTAYIDAEVNCGVGGQYYNLTSQVGRVCQTASGNTCTLWATIGGGGSLPGGGSVGQTVVNTAPGLGTWQNYSFANLASFPAACGSNLFITQIAASPSCTQPAFSNLSGTATSGQVPHAFLSAFHTDTVVGSPLLGDLISANATPAWARVPGPTTPNGVPQVPTSTPAGGVATQLVYALAGVPTNAQTGTTYTVAVTDRASYVSFNNAAAIAVTLPQAGTAGFGSNFVTVACDIGVGTATITPTTSTISYTNGSAYTSAAANLALTTGQCAWIYSDNTNYFAILRSGGAGGGTAWNAITNPAGNLALTMGSNTSTFNYATALANAWAWKNTTAATSGASQSSPLVYLCGRGWETGTPADTEDCYSFQTVIPNGANSQTMLTIVNTGGSTNGNAASVTLPGQVYANGGSVNAFNIGAQGSRSAALTAGGIQVGSGTRGVAFLSTANIDAGGIDADLSRIAPTLLGVGSGAAGDQTGLLVTGNTKRQVTASYTNATTTPSTFQTWTLPAIAQNYSYSCHGSYQGSVSTATLALSVNSSVAPTSLMAHARIFSTLTGTSTDATVTSTASGTVAVLTGAAPAANATNYEFYIEGTIEEPGAGGTFAIQAAAGGVGTLTILRGSFCQLY